MIYPYSGEPHSIMRMHVSQCHVTTWTNLISIMEIERRLKRIRRKCFHLYSFVNRCNCILWRAHTDDKNIQMRRKEIIIQDSIFSWGGGMFRKDTFGSFWDAGSVLFLDLVNQHLLCEFF